MRYARQIQMPCIAYDSNLAKLRRAVYYTDSAKKCLLDEPLYQNGRRQI